MFQKREKKNTDSFHVCLYQIIKDLTNDKGFILESSVIVAKILSELECEPIPSKPQTYENDEFGQLSVKSIIHTLKEVFGAKKPARHGNTRKLILDPVKLAKIGKLYEVSIDVKVIEVEGDVWDASDTSSKPVNEYNNKNNEETEHKN